MSKKTRKSIEKKIRYLGYTIEQNWYNQHSKGEPKKTDINQIKSLIDAWFELKLYYENSYKYPNEITNTDTDIGILVVHAYIEWLESLRNLMISAREQGDTDLEQEFEDAIDSLELVWSAIKKITRNNHDEYH